MSATITGSSVYSRDVPVKKALFLTGLLASVYYIAINIFVGLQYEGYSFASYTVSELSAIGAPTRMLWVMLMIIYTLLMIAFGWALVKQGEKGQRLHTAGFLLIISAVIGLAWPPMHQRQVLAAGGGTVTDTLHIAFTIVAVIFMLLIIGFCAASLGKSFRLYSIITVLMLLAFGILTSLDAPRMEKDLSTPMIGVWERISMASYMVWIGVLSVILFKKE
jgi:hypothetical protein